MNITHDGDYNRSDATSYGVKIDPKLVDLHNGSIISRFEKYSANRDPETGCWIWSGFKNWDGYGQLRNRGTNVGAHRVSYALHCGPVPVDLCVCHDCPFGDNPSCVNPDHLWLGTNSDNSNDRDRKGRNCHGDKHWFRKHPDKVRRGINHWAYKYPERRMLGDKNPSRIYRERMPRGVDHENSKLNEEQVRLIRQEFATGQYYKEELGRKYGVSGFAIKSIIIGRTWKHLL